MGHGRVDVLLVVVETTDVPDGPVGRHAVGQTLSAPINGEAGIATIIQSLCCTPVFFNVFCASGKDQDRSLGICRTPVPDADAQPIGRFEPMGGTPCGTLCDVVKERCRFHWLGQHASKLHRLTHIAVNAELAGHEGRCWVQFPIEDRLEGFGVCGERHISIVVACTRPVCVDNDPAFAFDHEFGGAVKASAIQFCFQGNYGFGHYVAHFFLPFVIDVTVLALVLAAQCATLGLMVTLTHRFKCIVTALFLAVGFSLPAGAQETTLDELYQQLLEADEATYPRIERQIMAQWERSGSPAMDLLLRRGKDALDDGQPDVAVEHFSALVDHAPGFAEGYYGRASSYYLLGLTGPALDDIRQTLRLNPRHFEAMRGLANIMQELGREADALELYELIVTINPQSAEAQLAIEFLNLQLEGRAL